VKIHIVQKGDTLWELAKKYNVDYEEMKQLNTQLSSPDMIMPGMKVKVPSSNKQVKEEGETNKKEVQKEQVEVPYKDMSAKPLPTIKEDDHAKPIEVKAEMPMQHMPMKPVMEMPVMEKEPPSKQKETPKETSKPMKETPIKEGKEKVKKEHPMMELPMMNEAPHMHIAHQQDHMKPNDNQEWYPMVQMVPVCCHCMQGHQTSMHQQLPFHHGTHVSPQQAMPMPHPSHMPDQMGFPNHPMMGAQGSPCGCQHRGGHGFEQQQHIPSMPPVESYDQHQIAMQQAHYARQAPYPPNYAMPPNEHAYPNPPGYDHNLGFNKPGDESE